MKKLLFFTFLILLIGIPSVYAHPFLLDSEPSQAANAPIGTTQIILNILKPLRSTFLN